MSCTTIIIYQYEHRMLVLNKFTKFASVLYHITNSQLWLDFVNNSDTTLPLILLTLLWKRIKLWTWWQLHAHELLFFYLLIKTSLTELMHTMQIQLTTTLPSISTRSWLRVFSLSSWPPKWPPRPRARPTASISSINIIQGAFRLAWANRSLTLAGPTPTNISRNSDPEMLRKGTRASPATALAKRVLPVPGGPDKIAPWESGITIIIIIIYYYCTNSLEL